MDVCIQGLWLSKGVNLSKSWHAFRLRRLAQSVCLCSRLNLVCSISNNVALVMFLVTCGRAFRLRRLAQGVCPRSGLNLGRNIFRSFFWSLVWRHFIFRIILLYLFFGNIIILNIIVRNIIILALILLLLFLLIIIIMMINMNHDHHHHHFHYHTLCSHPAALFGGCCRENFPLPKNIISPQRQSLFSNWFHMILGSNFRVVVWSWWLIHGYFSHFQNILW